VLETRGGNPIRPRTPSVRPPAPRKPEWLKIRPPSGESYFKIKELRESLGLATVCEEARCPNVAECWGSGTATFMLLGDTCTRACRFCNVKTGNPRGKVDAGEPEKVARAVVAMGLSYVVLTMVDRDDLPDGGAAHVGATVRALKRANPDLLVETLVGDFQGREEDLEALALSPADVLAHNVECVERLTREVRDPRCSYARTLDALRLLKRHGRGRLCKSSLMLGLGETEDEVRATLRDLRSAGVDVVTLGQYLQPSPAHLPVAEFVPPARFDRWREEAESLGFLFCASGPLVRSSYKAGEMFVERYLRASKSRPAAGHESTVEAPAAGV
jgi:lipoic acid synthetase